MKIRCLTPDFKYGTGGNMVTSRRWRELLKSMGHTVQITSDPKPQACDLLIALHARKNAVGIRRMAKQFPHVPIVVVLTGTDLYHDIVGNQSAQHSLDLAERLVVLQPYGVHALPKEYQKKTVTILQSAKPPAVFCEPLKHNFEPKDKIIASSCCRCGHAGEGIADRDPDAVGFTCRLLQAGSAAAGGCWCCWHWR